MEEIVVFRLHRNAQENQHNYCSVIVLIPRSFLPFFSSRFSLKLLNFSRNFFQSTKGMASNMIWSREASRNAWDWLNFVNRSMRQLAKRGEYAFAVSLCSDMIQGGIIPSYSTLNSLVTCYARMNQVDGALAALGSLFKKGYSPDIVAYTNLMQGLVNENRIKEAVDAFRNIETMGYKPDEECFHCVLHALFLQGNAGEAMRIFKQMEATGIAPGSRVYRTIIRGLNECGETEAAKALYEKMPRTSF